MSFMGFSTRDAKNLIKEAFPYLIDENKLYFYKNNILLTVSEIVIKGICFECSQYTRSITLTPFIQILIEPLDFISLSIGGRVPGHEGSGDYWYYLENASKAARSLSLMNKNIKKIVIPFLNDSKDINTLSDTRYQTKWKRFWGDSPSYDYTRCLIYSYVRKENEFHKTYEKLCPVYEKETRDWAKEEFKRLNNIRENLNDKEKLLAIFKEYITYSIQELKLEKLLGNVVSSEK